MCFVGKFIRKKENYWARIAFVGVVAAFWARNVLLCCFLNGAWDSQNRAFLEVNFQFTLRKKRIAV